jgi:hypothetical protein
LDAGSSCANDCRQSIAKGKNKNFFMNENLSSAI